MSISSTPPPPYYAVIFTSLKREGEQGYEAMSDKMALLAATMPGYLGHESARDGLGITVSYWASLEDIRHWKQQTSHLEAQQIGRSTWYSAYKVRICRVERDYEF